MAQINVQVIDVSAPIAVATAKGGYKYLEVAYKKDGKVEGKKVMDFVNKDLFQTVQKMEVGKSYDVEIQKNDKDYWEWRTVTPAVAGDSKVLAEDNGTGTGRNVVRAGQGGRVTGSNYETASERAVRQRLIVRQSSLSNSLTLLTHNNPKLPVDIAGVLALAESFTDWVFKTDPIEAIAKLEDDIPV